MSVRLTLDANDSFLSSFWTEANANSVVAALNDIATDTLDGTGGGPPVVSAAATIAALSAPEQALIATGSIVTLTDGTRWQYTGSGSKVLEASYVQLSDVTPPWSAITGKPTTLAGFGISDGLTAAAAAEAYQALDADLTAIAALTTATYGRSLLTAADAAAARTLLAAAPLASPSFTGTVTAVAGNFTNKSSVFPLAVNLSDGSNGGLRANGFTGESSDLGFFAYANGTQLASFAADGIQLINGDLYPFPSGARGVGRSDRRFGNVWAVTGDFSGVLTIPTATPGTNTGQAASTAFVNAAVAAGGSDYANVIHVAESGGDYTTLAAAKAAAVSGDLVVVHPGAYVATTSILKDGVNWHFEAGAIVSMDMTSNSTLVGILEDTTGITCQITGKGEFLADLTGRDGLPEITEITVSGTPGDGDYVTVHNFDDGTETSFYCKIDGVGTPSGSGNQVAVEVSGGFTTDDYAAALEAAMEANFFSATVSGSVVTATTDVKYSFTDASGTANFTISVLQQGVSLNAACIVKRVTGSVIDIEAHRIVLTSDDTNINFPYHITVWDEDGEGVTRASEIIATGQRTCATRWSNGPTHIYADKISGGYYGIWGDCNATPTGDYYITADLIEGTAGTGNAIWSNGTEAAAAMWIEAKIVKATGTNAVAIYTGSGKNYITAQKIFGKVAAGGQLFLRTDKLSPVANNTTLFSFTGICHIEVMTIDLNSFTGTILGSIIATAPSTVEIKNFVADSAGQELYLTGPVELLNSRLDYLACGNQKAVGIGDSNVKIRNSVLLGAGTGKDIDATGFTVNVCGGHGTGTSGHFRTAGTVNFLAPV